MDDLLAYMIGPKAENMEIFRKLVLEVLDDHMFWRRNFYPEDAPIITNADQNKKGYQEFIDRLRDRMSEFLGNAKKGIPFFSPRYIGHMNADLLMPALVGYIGAMLYNQNNVTGESSPVTIRMEHQVIQMLLKMVGLDSRQGFGYLCSGGTTANLYGLWMARNLRTLPIAIRLAVDPRTPKLDTENIKGTVEALNKKKLEVKSEKDVLNMLDRARTALSKRLTIETAKGERKPVLDMSAWELANVPVDEICRLRGRICELILDDTECDQSTVGILSEELVNRHTINHLGEFGFRLAAANLFPDDRALFKNPWHVYVTKNNHYSCEKNVNLLGLGQDCLVKIPHLPGFDVDLDNLERVLLDNIAGSEKRSWPLMLVSTFGTTQEGALDNLDGVHNLLSRLEKDHGATLWWHVDAAYGGYLPSMFRSSLDEKSYVEVGDINKEGTLKHWLAQCCKAAGLDPKKEEERQEIVDLIEMSESGDGWLSWQEVMKRTEAMKYADSITLDPHKLGYIPYPAGAVLLRKGVAREVVCFDAPYLFSPRPWDDRKSHGTFLGRFTIEGSRPGAAAAACWLAHSTVPLDQSGHGKLVALSMLATRRLHRILKTRLARADSPVRVAVLHKPHTNMICYVPYHTNSYSLDHLKNLTRRVLEKLKPTNMVRPFMAVDTEINFSTTNSLLEEAEAHSQFLSMLNCETEWIKIDVIRSVIMGPYALNAKTRSARSSTIHIFEEYANNLEKILQEASESQGIELVVEKRDYQKSFSKPPLLEEPVG